MPANEPDALPGKNKANIDTALFHLTLPADTELENEEELRSALTELARKHIVPSGVASAKPLADVQKKAHLTVST
jgi:hypothetical protein